MVQWHYLVCLALWHTAIRRSECDRPVQEDKVRTVLHPSSPQLLGCRPAQKHTPGTPPPVPTFYFLLSMTCVTYACAPDLISSVDLHALYRLCNTQIAQNYYEFAQHKDLHNTRINKSSTNSLTM